MSHAWWHFWGDDEQSILNLRRLSEQAAVLQNIEKIITFEQSIRNVNRGPLIAGIDSNESEITINKLYNFKQFITDYNKLTPADLSNLIPFIKIYKIYPDKNIAPRNIPFNNFYPKKAIDSITSSGSDRGFQANIVGLDFTSQGKDTATTFIYEVKIKFIFDSVATLFNNESKYIELFNPPKKFVEKTKNVREYNKDYYQIMLDFGWEGNIEDQSIISLNNKELASFIEASKSRLFLNYVKHTININEDGSVQLDVTYIGSLEMESRHPIDSNIMSEQTEIEIKEIQRKIEQYIENLKNKYGDIKVQPILEGEEQKVEDVNITDSTGKEMSLTKEKQDLKNLYEQKNSKEVSSIKEFTKTLINNIAQQYDDTLPYLEIPYTNYQTSKKIIENFSSYTDLSIMEQNKKLAELMSGNIANQRKVSVKNALDQAISFFNDDSGDLQIHNQKYQIRYFTFGSLIKALSLDNSFLFLATNCEFSSFNTEPGTGPLTTKDIQSNPNYKIIIDNGLSDYNQYAIYENRVNPINIFHIPISVSLFKYWFNKNILKQNLTSLSLLNFLNLCINELLILAIKPDNMDFVPKQNIKFKFFFDKLDLSKDNSLLTDVRIRNVNKTNSQTYTLSNNNIVYSLLDKNISGDIETKKVIIFYSIPTLMQRRRILSKDTNDGIPSFFYGAAYSTINKITFREENIPFFKEANIQSQVDKKPWKAGIFLRSKYNVLIESLGTVNYRVGSLFYVSPSFTGVVDVSEPLDYGIGGYFVLISIKTTIESGKYITTLEGNWVSTGTGEYTDLSHKGFTLIKLSKPLEQLQNESQIAIEEATPSGIRRGTT